MIPRNITGSESKLPHGGGIDSNGNGKVSHYGYRDLSNKVLAAVDREIIIPAIETAAIRTTAIASGRGGESSIREMAVRAFAAANGALAEETHELAGIMEAVRRGAEKHKHEISVEMDATQRYVRTHQDGTPWTVSDAVVVFFLVAFSGADLLVGINTNATVLMSSGIRAFEDSPFRAYLFCLVPIGIAAGLKALGSHIDALSKRRQYTIAVWGIGLIFGVIWASLFAATFPGLTESAADIVRNLTDSSASTASPMSKGAFVFCAMMAESLIAAGCWLTAQAICQKHELENRVDNPAYLKLQKDLDYWSKVYHQHWYLLGRLNGKIRALEEKEGHFVEQAVHYFRAAVKWASNHRDLEDFLNG